MLKASRNADPEVVAIAALTFLASDPEQLGRFLSVTGLGPDTLREAASEPGFAGQILAYVASDEALLLAFAANAGLHPETVARAYQATASNGDRYEA